MSSRVARRGIRCGRLCLGGPKTPTSMTPTSMTPTSSTHPLDAGLLRSTHLAISCLSNLLSGLQRATGTPATDVRAYAEREQLALDRVTAEMRDLNVRPSVLLGVSNTAFGLAGAAIAAGVPPRIRHAVVGGY